MSLLFSARRILHLARLPAGSIADAAVGAYRRRVRAEDGAAVAADMRRRSADRTRSVLGQAKGGALKAGQLLSTVGALFPTDLEETWQTALAALPADNPAVPLEELEPVLRAELGADWRRRFAAFDDAATAAASIGQVHSAVWPDGRRVAVKIQYPGVADALRTDLRLVSVMTRLGAMIAPGMSLPPLVSEMRDRLAEELDYQREGRVQEAFAAAFAHDRWVVVPAVVLATPRVLVTEWLDGIPFTVLGRHSDPAREPDGLSPSPSGEPDGLSPSPADPNGLSPSPSGDGKRRQTFGLGRSADKGLSPPPATERKRRQTAAGVGHDGRQTAAGVGPKRQTAAGVGHDGRQATRDAAAAAYMRFLLSGPELAGWLHTDPHPGNFRWIGDGPSGQLGVLDFGSALAMPEGMPRTFGRLISLLREEDPAATLTGLTEEGFVKPGSTVDATKLRDYLAPFSEPSQHEVFHFSTDWLRSQFGRLGDPRNPDFAVALQLTMPPEHLFTHRVWLGIVGVLCQLNATIEVREIVRRWLPGLD